MHPSSVTARVLSALAAVLPCNAGQSGALGHQGISAGPDNPGQAGTEPCVEFTIPTFSKGTLTGATVLRPTSLQFGPDGRLYVSEMGGVLHVYSIVRTSPLHFEVSAEETLDQVLEIENHDDLGVPLPSVVGRLVTGICVRGTPSQPEILVSSSDPRIHGEPGSNADTNSGVLSRLRRVGSAWVREDLVRGLPRSLEAHVTSGMAIDEATGVLYLCQAGTTNEGAPSSVFGNVPEYALSAAILSVDLNALGAIPYDLPTLDDEDRPGDPDAGDPFGGNLGKNQARLVPGGPVQVHSPGWRNPYDVVRTDDGKLYAFDNGPNPNWGPAPAGCSNAPDDSASPGRPDQLHCVSAAGDYAGHANPTRGNAGNTFNASNPQSPVAQSNPLECTWLDPNLPLGHGGDGALALVPSSTNGITQYRASNFQGTLRGELLTVSFDRTLRRIALAPDGGRVDAMGPLVKNVAVGPLDVTALDDAGPFPGTIWIADYSGNAIVVLEPVDYDRSCGTKCTAVDASDLDEDGDGYVNSDEISNGSNPCAAADTPPDFDGDLISDLRDADDDGDGLSDKVDRFALDASNGLSTSMPLTYSWFASDPGHGLFGLGFTGLMSNGSTNYAAAFDPQLIIAGGAAGVLTIDGGLFGTPVGHANSQRSAFQFGVAADAAVGTYRIETRMRAPFFDGQAAQDNQSQGLFAGVGNQDDFVRLVLAAGGIELGMEVAGSYQFGISTLGGSGIDHVDLRLTVEPLAGSVRGSVSVDDAAYMDVGTLLLPPSGALRDAFLGPPALAVGVMACGTVGHGYPATWDWISVQPGP